MKTETTLLTLAGSIGSIGILAIGGPSWFGTALIWLAGLSAVGVALEYFPSKKAR